MNRTLRAKAAGALLAAAAAAATLSLATAGPASATTFPGPAGSGEILPDTAGQFGDPANIYARATSSGQVIEDGFDSDAWGSAARTFGANGSNAQRVYFERVGSRTLVWDSGAGTASTPGVGVYKILHYTASGKVLCLDADGSAGAPGAGSAVSWYGCDPNFGNQPNQLWTYAPVAHRANGDASTPSALVNIGSLATSQTSMDVRTAPILAAAANQQGTNSALTLVAQPSATAANSSWHLTDVASS